MAERSVRKQAVNPKKLHTVDWALGYSFAPEPDIDVGWKLENAVFLHWRRTRSDLAYIGGNSEIDLVPNPERPEALIDVAYSVTRPTTWQREIASLEHGASIHPRARRVPIVHERGPQQAPPGIEVVETWRHLSARCESDGG